MNLPNASEAAGQLRSRWHRSLARSEGLGRRIGFAVLLFLVALEIGIVGYQIGYGSGVEVPEGDAIRHEALRSSFDQARADAAAAARPSGARAGRRAGELAGGRAGARAGGRKGAAAAERVQARIARQEAAEAALAAAAARRRSRQAEKIVSPVTDPTPTPVAPVATPAPTPQAPQTPSPPCFDAAGHPC